MNIDFAYYRSIFWRRFPYFIVVASILTSIALTIAMILPAQYEARATLLIEGARIPDDLAASTVTTSAGEQVQIIRQRLMTRANLIDTAERLSIYEREDGEPVRPSFIVNDMMARTTFTADFRRNQTPTISISFRAPDPQTAAEVTNEFVDLVLRESTQMRTGVAGETLAFFRQDVERYAAQLDTQAGKIIEFRKAAGRALPESEGFLVDRQVSMRDRLIQISRELEQIEDQRVRLIDLVEQNGDQIDLATATPTQRALVAARDQLDGALLVYSEASPQVRLLQARVAQLEQRVIAEQARPEAEETDQRSPQEILLEAQLAELDDRVGDLREEAATLEANVAEIEEVLARIPSNGVALRALQREHDAIQSQLQNANQRLAAAETGERIELLSKGERLTIIEQATPPSAPSRPNRGLIAGAGAAAGLALGLGVVVLLELLNRAIRRPAEISDRLGITPIAVLPYIRTDAEVAWRRLLLVLMLCGMIFILPLTIFLLHSFVVPLDGFANTILQRFGFTLPSSGG